MLNRNLPLTIEQPRIVSSESHYDEDSGEYDDDTEVMYLTEADPVCYCDETCIRYGDCCSDYTYVCPRKDLSPLSCIAQKIAIYQRKVYKKKQFHFT